MYTARPHPGVSVARAPDGPIHTDVRTQLSCLHVPILRTVSRMGRDRQGTYTSRSPFLFLLNSHV